jgi:ribonuclease HII
MTVVGVDEAGRGPIAGPVVAAAAALAPFQFRVLLAEGLNDSKKLTARARERLFSRMSELGVAWAAQATSNVRIDRTNILMATLWAMRRAAEKLAAHLGTAASILIIVDGNSFIPGIPCETQRAIPKADGLVPAVMAASVAAKVLHDRAMLALDHVFPEYDFASNKGYPTKRHRILLDMLGPSSVHRLSFKGYNKDKMNGRQNIGDNAQSLLFPERALPQDGPGCLN